MGALDFDRHGIRLGHGPRSAGKQYAAGRRRGALDVVSRFDQLVAFTGMQLAAAEPWGYMSSPFSPGRARRPGSRIGQSRQAYWPRPVKLTGALLVPDACSDRLPERWTYGQAGWMCPF